jgi:hypothetical protein
LTETHLGPLPLNREAKISVAYLTQIFPTYNVSHEIGSGDSPDFHYFRVVARDGEVLFTITSFLREGNGNDTQNAVPIDLLKVVSRGIRDKYGLRVGDRVAAIVRARGKTLEFGASHHDVYLGGNQIVYNIRTSSDLSPERLTLADAIRENWRIVSISWPTAAWE